jgi:serine/threonine protein kinase HipA of HipAB toxin-antitoxin module
VYPNGLRARLAPVYDFVSTVVYPTLGPQSALRWSDPPEPTLDPAKSLVTVTMDDLLAAASYASADTSVVMDDLSEFSKNVRATWPAVAESAPEVVRERVAAHLRAASLR